MEDQKTPVQRAQDIARAEVKQFMDDMVGVENCPVEVIIVFRCPDGKFGYYSTPGDTLEMVGMLEAAKAGMLSKVNAIEVQPTTGEPTISDASIDPPVSAAPSTH